MKRILIVNVNWLGDTLFATPFIRAVRERYPDSYIAILTHPRCYGILEGNPNINEIIIYDEKKEHRNILRRFSTISYLRSKRFDAAFILKKSLTRTLILLFSKIPHRIGYNSKRAGFLLTIKVPLPRRQLHKVEYFLNLARAVGIDSKNKNYEISISQSDKDKADKIIREAGIGGEPFIAINAGGNWGLKRWPVENFASLTDEIFDRLKVKVILTGAEKDILLAKKVLDLTRNKPIILCGKTDLKTLGAIFKRAVCIISNDSGPMHLAVASGATVIALFGPTSPELTGPYGDSRYKVLHKDIGCKIPCYNLTCEDNRCMKAITVKDVLGAIDEIIKCA